MEVWEEDYGRRIVMRRINRLDIVFIHLV